MTRPRLPKPPALPRVDLSDALVFLGVALIAWTIYLLWPVVVPAFVGGACIAIAFLKELAHGTARRSADRTS